VAGHHEKLARWQLIKQNRSQQFYLAHEKPSKDKVVNSVL
jgi:hypothetical protein